MKPPHGQRLARIRAALAEGPTDSRTLAAVAGYDAHHEVLAMLGYLRRTGEAECVRRAGKGRGNKKPAIWGPGPRLARRTP